ncbi:MAG TPA: alkaline phosphatase family protein [Gemmataceae bacterium]|jgi:predicted AlkP superfamily phosphohydrolase/phosphomutase|nr:alkaline phosphatase family protein [Gemmataceae bacterium]
MPVPADKYKVLVLGLDGATFELMLPWIEEGHLPCLGRLVHEGAWSHLRSTIPPITPCAWSSFMTGKNPGKHGLFDFVEPLPGRRGFRFTNASSRHAESLWGYLSRHGHRVGVINVPMTYPPEPVNGYLISGLDTPDERSRYMYPKELRKELLREGVGYRLDIRHIGNMRTDARRDWQLREHCEIETLRTRALQYLRRQHPSDFTMLVYTATDQIQHQFWHYMDPTHDKHDARGAERYRHAIRDVYVHLDGLIASVLQDHGDDTVVMLMSDHGFGPTTNVRLRLNQALEQAGLLAFRPEGASGRFVRSTAGLVDRLLRSTLSAGAKRLIASVFPRLRVWFEDLDEAHIDWDRTAAFTNEVSRSFPMIWVNRGGETAQNGANGRQRDAVLQATEEALTRLTDPQTGRPVISHVYRTRDVYHGPYVAKAPDLIPSWWEDGFLLEQSVPGGRRGLTVERSKAPIQGGVEFSGSHRLNGVFVMAGGPTRRGCTFTGAQIIDVAPTVLYLMGLPIPGDMDGRPLLQAIDPAFVAGRPPQYAGEGPGPAAPVREEAETVFSEEEAEMIARRLQSMGYIE